MKKIKYTIIYIAGLLVFSLSIVTVFAAFVFNQKIDSTANLGDIRILHKDFYDYSYDKTSSDLNLAKLRKDTVAILDGITLKYTNSYSLTSDEIYIDGKNYYKYENEEYVLLEPSSDTQTKDYEVGDEIEGSVYENAKVYSGINSISVCQYYSNSTFSNFIYSKSNEDKTLTFTINSVEITITVVVDSLNGIITNATVATNNTNKHYRVKIDIDGLGMLVLDDDITNTLTTGYTVVDASTAITCSASEGKYYTDLEKANMQSNYHPYLSQLGLHFEFQAEMDVYVRIHIRDAWEKIKEYSTSSRETYTIKDQISGQSPFTVNDSDWYYDEGTNCIYLREMYHPEYVNGVLQSRAYTFTVNEAYFYQVAVSTAYTEYVNVQVSFTVDIVQANRAKALWKVDPSQIGQ
ncbi:hypothetical protein EI71_01514 [Anaeroplasma bactoclasticum]|jgi:hypothetical protein|uniref:Uncharacterized protein n=1 Tax=Anaeroplasma bactoclasticum TaxID=2088 RepID=A0A397RRS9_9MOLU|nr:hypothetical protein [Anaeroplasma bactoclasticum]RIA75426.1 hypothetical protein EI71_01514 [Anaeroplasma bactoclasticum]